MQATSNLNRKHIEEWQASAVELDIIDRNVWSIEDARELDQLLNRNTDRRWKHSEDLVPGWAVAGVSPKTGERTFKGAQYKPDKPPIDPDTKKARKYLNPAKLAASPLFLEMADPDYWSKLLLDVTSPIVLTEGAKKAGALLSQGIPCISIPGVTTGGKLGRLRPELEMYCRYGRTIYLAFDRDIITKRQVRNALHNLGRMIAVKGAVVHVLEWDNRYKGVDDFIASGGNIRDRLYAAKTLEEWRDDQEDEPEERSDVETCKLALRYRLVEERLRGRVRWNDLKSIVELDGQPADVDGLRLYLALKHNLEIPSEDCTQIVTYLAKQQTFNPVAEYLHQCAALYDPDSELLDSLAKTYLGADSPLHATFIRKTLISAVARALSPGCKVDSVCILSGAQGVGKSSFWRVLAGDWFDDSIGSVSDKDERLKLHQSWFVEWAELEAVFKRKDVSAVKAFITTQYDQIRPPYGRVVKEFPRPSVIVGTTNFDEFLADPTGNRRFWVVPIKTPFIPLDELASDRDRIWAAATHAFLSGETWTLPTEMRQMAVEAGHEYEMSDPWEEPVLSYVADRQKVTATDILTHAIGLDIDRQDRASQMRVTNLLKSNGWTSKRQVVHARRLRFWIPPNSNKDSCPSCPEEVENQESVDGQPTGQPIGQPAGQPPNLTEPPLSTPLLDNLTDQDNEIPKSTPAQQTALYNENEPSKKVNDSPPTDCQIYVKGQWQRAKYMKPLNKSVLGSDRTLNSAHVVMVGAERVEIAACDLQRDEVSE